MIGTLDIYAAEPQDWDSSEAAAPQANAGLVASLLTAAVTTPGDTPSRPRTGDRRLAASAAGDRRSCSEPADLKPACTVRRHVLRRLPPR